MEKTNRESGKEALRAGVDRSLDRNIEHMEKLFEDVDILRTRKFETAKYPNMKYAIYYFDGVIDSDLINESIIRPLVLFGGEFGGTDIFSLVRDRVLFSNEISEAGSFEKIVESVTYGDTVLFIDGCKNALIINSKGFTLRGIIEPEGERVLSGPREGFTEGIMQNLSMVRRRLRTNELKLKFRQLGVHSKTSVCIAYMDNIVNKKILDELYRRLDGIDLDAILDSNYIAEYISEKSLLGFSTVGTTERPDVVVGKLMEGRIVLLVDGSPVALTLPYLFTENFQSSEDYYMNPMYASFSRILRMLCFLFTCTVPAAYIAVVGYHHEALPTSLMIHFASERSNAPFPASFECFVMLILFDILRETGVRMPVHVGQAMSIVGALVIGQSAVEAKLIAAPMVIIVAFTGITILLVPRLTTSSLVARYMCLLLSCLLGVVGVTVGISILLLHLLRLETFGVPYILTLKKLRYQEVKDVFIRGSWPGMITRIRNFTDNLRRQKKYEKGK